MAIDIKMAPSHPGAVIKELILPADITITRAAKALRISRQSLDALVNERRSITPEMAIKIETVFGGKAANLLSLQGRYDLYRAEQNSAQILKGLVPYEARSGAQKSA